MTISELIENLQKYEGSTPVKMWGEDFNYEYRLLSVGITIAGDCIVFEPVP